MAFLRNFLAYPLTRGMDIDHPKTTILRKRIVKDKAFLHEIYQEWYHLISESLPGENGKVLELGSGAGFLPEIVSGVISSELFWVPEMNLVCDGLWLPYPAASLRAIVMTNVFHHIPDPIRFFNEALRCIRPRGRIVMIEPWVSNWSRLIYPHLHHEPFNPEADSWDFHQTGPISGANGALSWIVLKRDRVVFQNLFPQWEIISVKPMMPIVYLLSGGISMRSLMPGWSYPFWRWVENIFQNQMDILGMFACIVLQKS